MGTSVTSYLEDNSSFHNTESQSVHQILYISLFFLTRLCT